MNHAALGHRIDTPNTSLVWLRRDLRISDNHALYRALSTSSQVYCVFVFDIEILDSLADRADRRVEFIHESLLELNQTLIKHGSRLTVLHGHPRDEIPLLASRLKVSTVFANRDYEPDAVRRDDAVALALEKLGIEFITCKDQVIFEKNEVLTQDGQPFSVFTAYKNRWLKRLVADDLQAYPSEKLLDKLAHTHAAWTACGELPSLEALGFAGTHLKSLNIHAASSGASRLLDDFLERIEQYHETRNYPCIKGPSYLSVHLRFGTISIRALARIAWERNSLGAQTWLSELIWRDFYFMILHHHPRVVTESFRPEFNALRFTQDRTPFEAWCNARTGYPLVDAAMRQLNQTGYMHNRLRMVTASFLVKDLHIDWRWGERYFAKKLNDFDLAANNGGWQWAASTGCDAQPYFRIFNPLTQSKNFDPEGKFIRKYVPELATCTNTFIHAPWLMSTAEQARTGITIGREYPAPIVDHGQARRITLDLFAAAKSAHAALT